MRRIEPVVIYYTSATIYVHRPGIMVFSYTVTLSFPRTINLKAPLLFNSSIGVCPMDKA
jgi:hypothetical protein